MNILKRFPDFTNTSSIDERIEKRLAGLRKRLEARYRNPVITLTSTVSERRSDKSAAGFTVEIQVKTPKSKAPLIAKKENASYQTALNGAIDTMESIVNRDLKKSESRKRTPQVIQQSEF